MINRRFVYSNNKKITAIKSDIVSNYVWMAYEKNTSNVCILKKQLAFEPSQTFFTVEVSVESINDLDINSSYLYTAYDDADLIGQRFLMTNPLTSVTDIDKPVGVTEEAVALGINGSDLWYLIPGEASGTNAKLIKYNTSGVFQETVDLVKSGSVVNNAKSFDFDSNGDIWIIAYTNPAEYIRVYELSGGGYDFQIFQTV